MNVEFYHQPTSLNRDVLAASPTLRAGFRPPRWARSPHVQIGLFMLNESRAPDIDWALQETLVMADGGTVSLDWCGDLSAATAPTLILLPTICGNGHDHRGIVRALHRDLGWAVVVCNRRGHAGIPMTAPRFNTLGDAADLRAQVDHIQARRPDSPLYAVGLSAGSGLLVRYLGELGSRSPIRAGVLYSPGYDLEYLFERVHPAYSRIMTRRVVDYFLRRHEDTLRDLPGYERACAARDLAAFHERVHHLSGFDSRQAYLAATNPMVVAHDIRVPMLVINAEDDPVCRASIVHELRTRLIASLPHTILAVTRYGSHCGHFHGVGRTWSRRVITEYLRAVSG